MENTLKELENFHIDCIYGKKKHYNARDRLRAASRRLGNWIIGFSAATGTSAFATLAGVWDWLKIATAMLSVPTAVLAAIQKNQNFHEQAERHHVAANQYLVLAKEAQRWIAYANDGNITAEEIRDHLEKMSLKAAEIQKVEPETLPKDYELARKGVDQGEEEYDEMNDES